VTNQKGFSLIEFLIVTSIGLFILGAAFMLQAGSVKLFKDVKTTADNLQTKTPSMELIARYFDRWGVGVASTGTDCTSYPPSDPKCIRRVNGTNFDDVTFWGSVYGTGCVESEASGSASLYSCRLNRTTAQNCYYVWRNNLLQNEVSSGTIHPLALNANLSPGDADCSSLSASNASVSSTMAPVSGSTSVVLQGGDMINRAPHQIRLYVAANANDGNRNWLYTDLTDTSACALHYNQANNNTIPVAPVDGFRVTLLPSGCDATSGGCTSAQVSVTFRSQSTKYDRGTNTYQVARVFGR
jgi:prepilin-type N-terminal cleavage/methylation domain-containing protein